MKNVTIEFSQEQLSVLNDALGNMPFKVAAPLVQHINREIQKFFDADVDARDAPSNATTHSANEIK
jgi:hypothetical protein